jgi:hypothetical protein
MGPRVPLALLPFGHYPIKYLKQVAWLSCEIEALSIAAAIKHYNPFIIQSSQQVCLLTDSKPCVQAFQKLYRGEFLASPRVTSFLSIISRYQAIVSHLARLAWSANISSDFASRIDPEYNEQRCQICASIVIAEDSVVRSTTVQDVRGLSCLPFTTRSSWLHIRPSTNPRPSQARDPSSEKDH